MTVGRTGRVVRILYSRQAAWGYLPGLGGAGTHVSEQSAPPLQASCSLPLSCPQSRCTLQDVHFACPQADSPIDHVSAGARAAQGLCFCETLARAFLGVSRHLCPGRVFHALSCWRSTVHVLGRNTRAMPAQVLASFTTSDAVLQRSLLKHFVVARSPLDRPKLCETDKFRRLREKAPPTTSRMVGARLRASPGCKYTILLVVHPDVGAEAGRGKTPLVCSYWGYLQALDRDWDVFLTKQAGCQPLMDVGSSCECDPASSYPDELVH